MYKLTNIGNVFIQFGKSLNYVLREFVSLPMSAKVMIFFLVVIATYYSLKNRMREGFQSKLSFNGLAKQRENFKQLEDQQVYDVFFADIYDDLIFDEDRHRYEIKELTRNVGLQTNSRVIDVGCGTGDRVNALRQKGIQCEGIDIAPAFVQKALSKFPSLNKQSNITTLSQMNGKSQTIVRQANALEASSIPPSSVTHVLCMNFTIYCIHNKSQFFANVYEWLEPGGTFVLHLVNRNKFDPILPGGDPFIHVNPQHFVKNRILDTEIIFKDLHYKAKFNLNREQNSAQMIEHFKDRNNKKSRKHIHNLDMPTQRTIIDQALEYGFTLKGKIDMEPCGYEHQYLYVLIKS